MTRRIPILAILLVGALAPRAAHATPVDLRVVRLEGVLDPHAVAALERAASQASRLGDGLLLVVDSPGGDLALAQKAMLSVLFSGAPVVAWVPPDGRASGAALLPLMGAGLITMAPTARLGSRHGLGRFAASALGPFGERLFAAASEARSGSVDWMIVTLSDGGQIDARGAKRRGVAAVVAKDLDALGRALRGTRVTVPLTGEVAVLSGRRIETGSALSRAASRPWQSPATLAALLCTALAMLALGVRRPSWGPLAVVSLVALGVVLRSADAVPIDRAAIVLCGVGAILLGAAAALRRGLPLVLAAAPCVALGARLLVDIDAPGQYLDEVARVPPAAAAFVAVMLSLLVLALRRLPPRPESFRHVTTGASASDALDSVRSK